MKLILFTLLLTITLSNCFYFRTSDFYNLRPKQSDNSIEDFWNSFFHHFNLDSPKELLQCFNSTKTAKLFFAHIHDVGALVHDAEARNTVQVHLDIVKLLAVHKALQPVFACVNQTQDYLDVLKALGIEHNYPHFFEVAKYIYYQANFGELAQEFPVIIAALDNNDYKSAGDLHAALIQHTVNELQDTGFHVQILKGLWNGVHIALGLPDSASILECWNNQTAAIRLEFIYGLANATSSGDVNDAAHNTELWYNTTGTDLIKQIPKSAWQCWANSTDTQQESKKLGVDITSKDFYEKVDQFVHSHQKAYWKAQKAIKDSFDQLNFNHAGSAYGHLLQAAVNNH